MRGLSVCGDFGLIEIGTGCDMTVQERGMMPRVGTPEGH
jgi:hypothetical protein